VAAGLAVMFVTEVAVVIVVVVIVSLILITFTGCVIYRLFLNIKIKASSI
jgi:hypothetical protein